MTGSRHTQAWVESRSTVMYTGFPKDPIGKDGKVSLLKNCSFQV